MATSGTTDVSWTGEASQKYLRCVGGDTMVWRGGSLGKKMETGLSAPLHLWALWRDLLSVSPCQRIHSDAERLNSQWASYIHSSAVCPPYLCVAQWRSSFVPTLSCPRKGSTGQYPVAKATAVAAPGEVLGALLALAEVCLGRPGCSPGIWPPVCSWNIPAGNDTALRVKKPFWRINF